MALALVLRDDDVPLDGAGGGAVRRPSVIDRDPLGLGLPPRVGAPLSGRELVPEGPWRSSMDDPELVSAMKLPTGSLLEIPTSDAGGLPDGTAIVEVLRTLGLTEDGGLVVEAKARGASQPLRSLEFDRAFSADRWGNPKNYLHLCAGSARSCPAAGPAGRGLTHVDAMRLRSRSGVTEAWFRRAEDGGDRRGDPEARERGPAGDARPARSTETDRLEREVRGLERSLREARRDQRGVGSQLAAAATGKAEDHRRSRKRRRRHDSRSSSSRPSSGEEPVFRDAPSRQTNSIRKLAEAEPGRLLKSGMEEILRVMGNREGAMHRGSGRGEAWARARVVGYLQAVLLGRHPPEKVGVRSMQELRTLAECLDRLNEGRLAEVGDILMQRFKALEQAIADGHWGVAQELEIIGEASGGLASTSEQRAAARAEYLRNKLFEARRKGGAASSGR